MKKEGTVILFILLIVLVVVIASSAYFLNKINNLEDKMRSRDIALYELCKETGGIFTAQPGPFSNNKVSITVTNGNNCCIWEDGAYSCWKE
jgi:uncharacterized protein YpmB